MFRLCHHTALTGHFNALLDASNSTGSVTTWNASASTNSQIPAFHKHRKAENPVRSGTAARKAGIQDSLPEQWRFLLSAARNPYCAVRHGRTHALRHRSLRPRLNRKPHPINSRFCPRIIVIGQFTGYVADGHIVDAGLMQNAHRRLASRHAAVRADGLIFAENRVHADGYRHGNQCGKNHQQIRTVIKKVPYRFSPFSQAQQPSHRCAVPRTSTSGCFFSLFAKSGTRLDRIAAQEIGGFHPFPFLRAAAPRSTRMPSPVFTWRPLSHLPPRLFPALFVGFCPGIFENRSPPNMAMTLASQIFRFFPFTFVKALGHGLIAADLTFDLNGTLRPVDLSVFFLIIRAYSVVLISGCFSGVTSPFQVLKVSPPEVLLRLRRACQRDCRRSHLLQAELPLSSAYRLCRGLHPSS